MPYALLIDTTKCIGDRACQVACKQWNKLPAENTIFNPERTNPPDLSSKTWTHIKYILNSDKNGELKWNFVKMQCMHCKDPACASACLVGAMYKTKEGPVVYDAKKCMGCRYCMLACPFNIPKFEWSEVNPQVKKCNFCADRLASGMTPACAKACTTEALVFGDYNKVIREAESRIASNPSRYTKTIYGKNEVGGTSVLYLSGVQFANLGLKENLRREPLPNLTWESLSKIPGIVGGGAILLSAIWFITKRRMENIKDIEKHEKDSK